QRGTDALNTLLLKRIAGFSWEVTQTLAWAGLGLLVMSGVALFMMRDVTRSLGQVVSAANQIAAGDLAISDLPTSRKDEIGVLAKAFDKTVLALKEMSHVAERIAAGDLVVAVTPRSERDVLGHALAN